MVLVIDNYDSFTYNLVQYLGELGCEVSVYRNNEITLGEIEAINPDHILISPGPGDPDDAGISLAVIRRFHRSTPILGVCLGHQVIGQAFGGKIIRAKNLMHGKTSSIRHDGQGVFANVPSPFAAARYHSLIVDEDFPNCLTVTARTPDGEMMGLQHKDYPTIGVQFHPESILTEHGHLLLKNFLEMKKMTNGNSNASPHAAHSVATAANPIQAALSKVTERKHLREDEAEAVMAQIMRGEATPAQIGGYLIALRMKGETVAEITGSARAMRNACIRLQPQTTDLIDIVGTGGDKAGTFNISTTTAFVVVGAGQPVAKHGNRAVSSNAGSADVLQALGVNLNIPPLKVADVIDEVGLGFMFAPHFHPAMKYAVGPRRDMAVRSIFNVLGPITNPAGVPSQIAGVYDSDLTHTIAEVLGCLGSERAYVVHGYGGLDELTTAGPNQVSILQNGQVHTTTLDPQELGFEPANPDDLLGGDAEANAAITRAILSGEDKSPRRDVVLLNASAALISGGKAETLSEGIALAAESIDSGAAMEVLENLVKYTQKLIKN